MMKWCQHACGPDAPFPRRGYTFQVWFFQEQENDILKGEVPFSVLAESD
jgi:hypothetical protein